MHITTIRQDNSSGTIDDLNCENIINIYKMIIPEEIEELYVRMTNVIDKYTLVHRNSKDWMDFKKKISSLVRRRDRHNQIEKELQEKIAILSRQEETNPNIYDEIILLSEKAKNEYFAAKKAEEEIEETKKSFNGDIKETASDTKIYLGEITELLQTIKDHKFDIDSIDLEKYINIIDSFNVDDKQKKLLKSVLSSYISLRISIFRKMKELAQIIVSAYEENTYLDLNMLSKENEQYLIALIAGDINIGDATFESSLRSISPAPLNAEKLNNEAITMKIVSNYLDNGILDIHQMIGLQNTLIEPEYEKVLSRLKTIKNAEKNDTVNDEIISEENTYEVGKRR